MAPEHQEEAVHIPVPVPPKSRETAAKVAQPPARQARLPEVELVLPCEVVKCPPAKKCRTETVAKDAQPLGREATAAKGAQASRDEREKGFRIPIGRGDARERLDRLRGVGRSSREETDDLVRSGWRSSVTEGRAQPSGARGGEERGVARRLASTVSIPSSSALRIAEAAPIWIAGVDATLPTQPTPAAKPTLTLPVDLPTAVVTAAAPAASFACVDIRQNPELIARLEQSMRSKAQKASQHISMAAQLRKDREEKEAQQKMVCAPVRGVQVAEPKRDVSSRAAAAPRAADRPRTQPKVVIEPSTGQASHPAKSALKKATSLKPARTEEERLNVSVRYAKETEVVDAHRKKAASKGKVRFVGVESTETSAPAVPETAVLPPLPSTTTSAPSDTERQLEAAATQYARHVPPPRPKEISEALLKTMAHLVGGEIDPDRAEPFSVRVSVPVVTADYCHHHLAFKVLDALERSAGLPSDRAQWLDYLTQEIAGSEELSGTYALTRISVGAMLAMHEWMTDGADLRKRHRDASVSLSMKEMFQGVAAGDKTVPTVMSTARLENYLDTAFHVDQRMANLLTSSSMPSTSTIPQEASADGQIRPSTSGGGVVSVLDETLEAAASALGCSLDTTLTIPETQLLGESMEDSYEVVASHADSEGRATVQDTCITVSSGRFDVLLSATTQSSSDSTAFADLPTLASSPLAAQPDYETWQDIMLDMPAMEDL